MGSSIKGANTTAKSVYRNLLKAVRKHIGEEEHKSHFTDFIKQEFRKNINSENPQQLQLARDYTLHINSVHHHKCHVPVPASRSIPTQSLKDLLFSYNIAVGRSAEMKRVLGKSAASVGLRLPEAYQS